MTRWRKKKHHEEHPSFLHLHFTLCKNFPNERAGVCPRVALRSPVSTISCREKEKVFIGRHSVNVTKSISFLLSDISSLQGVVKVVRDRLFPLLLFLFLICWFSICLGHLQTTATLWANMRASHRPLKTFDCSYFSLGFKIRTCEMDTISDAGTTLLSHAQACRADHRHTIHVL